MYTNYGVSFNYHGKLECIENGDRKLKKQVEALYMAMYNALVDMVNPMFETWNKEFNRTHPDKDGYSTEYELFIKQKMMEIVDEYNRNHTVPGKEATCMSFGVDDEAWWYAYFPVLGNYDTGDYMNFYLTK